MSYVARRSLLLKALALVSLLTASSLLSQVVEIGNACSEYCHAVGTVVYNDLKRQGVGEERALSGGASAMEGCMEDPASAAICS